ncbi:hypothetical protein AAG570_000069 [Ranatra chinensis]|uniref:Large ribosomal subunit protein mL44 n=1 Tax=Ranatra chinensis TaxID=642074 RepID=A0ABD0Z8N1_9HEMI
MNPTAEPSIVFRNYDAELYAFGKRLGEEFDKELLRQALTERSYIVQEENRQKSVGIESDLDLSDNNFFVFEGEQLMSDYVTQYLKTNLPRLPSEYIKNIHDFLLHEDTLADVSKNIGLDDVVLCAEFPVEKTTLARALKGVVQALALSEGGGNARAKKLVRDFVVTQLAGQDLTPLCSPDDAVGTLSAILQEQGRSPPEPRLIGQAGCNTILAAFQVGIYVDRVLIGKGFGESIEEAKEVAACDALWRMWDVAPNRQPFPFDLEPPPSHGEIFQPSQKLHSV